MAFFIGNSFCSICQKSEDQLKSELSLCIDGLNAKGIQLTHSFIQSARIPGSPYFWTKISIKNTENNNSLYFKIHLDDTKEHFLNSDCDVMCELHLHSKIYSIRPDVNAIFHAKSPYLNYVIKNGLNLVHAEAALILGDIPIIEKTSTSEKISEQSYESIISRACTGEPLRPIRILFLNGNGILSLGGCIHESRAFLEIIDEWAKFSVISRLYNDNIHVLSIDQLRDLGSRYARSIKFGGRINV
ncbi:MAG TPA: class II aldolase/adducin family protein [Nitrososphaeraceae archaeon]|nr:class II aldolase/adducin family protein [Nitrososphaeraceae archaeon]